MTFVSGERCWREMTDDWLAILFFFKLSCLFLFTLKNKCLILDVDKCDGSD